jgi:IPT/TIG domain
MSRWRRGELEEPHAKALEALGKIQESRRAPAGRAPSPNRPARPGPSPTRPARPGPYQAAPPRPPRRRSPGVLPWAVAVLILLNLAAGAVLALSLTNSSQNTPSAQGSHPTGTHKPTSATTAATSPSDRVTSSTAPGSSSLPAQPPGAGPVLAGISPASGQAGQVVTLTGTGLFSANGVITVTFGSAQASVVCQTETACRATVPPRGAASSGTVSVTVKTQSGTSNKLAFSYA